MIPAWLSAPAFTGAPLADGIASGVGPKVEKVVNADEGQRSRCRYIQVH